MDITMMLLHSAIVLYHLLSMVSDGNCMTNPEPLYERPVFKTNKTLFTFREGQTAVLLCSVENLEDKNVIWRLASDPSPLTVGTMGFSEDPRLSVEHDERGNWNLIIKDVTLKDAGVYECQVSSKIRHLRHHVTLMVTAAPEPDGPMRKKNIQITGKDFVDEGDPIKLVCKATSTEYPLEHIDWFRSGNTLTTDMSRGVNISMRYSVNAGSIESTLIIKKAKLEDRGHYTCRASNRDVIGKRVNVLKGFIGPKERRDTDPGGTEAGSGNAHRQEDRNTGNDVSLHWMTSLFLSLTCYLLQKCIYRSGFS